MNRQKEIKEQILNLTKEYYREAIRIISSFTALSIPCKMGEEVLLDISV